MEAASTIPAPGWRRPRDTRFLPFKGSLGTWDGLVAWFNQLDSSRPRIVHAGLANPEPSGPGVLGAEGGALRPRLGPHRGVHIAANSA